MGNIRKVPSFFIHSTDFMALHGVFFRGAGELNGEGVEVIF